MSPPRRKKWTEAEEKTLIDKYGVMTSDGTLAKMKTREKKFRPIALYVNSVHHVRDPAAYPWQWTWKDVSTKVQNMRHQYSLVKQKIKKPGPEDDSGGGHGGEEFDWAEGLTHWSNFLRYKEVFGDVPLASNVNGSGMVMELAGNGDSGEGFAGNEMVGFRHLGHDADGDFVAGINGGDNELLELGFDYEGEGDAHYNNDDNNVDDHAKGDKNNGCGYEVVDPNEDELRNKRRGLNGFEKRTWRLIANQLQQLREMETRFEKREMERERERRRRQRLLVELEQKQEEKFMEREMEKEVSEKARERLKRQREAMDEESEERERKRREDELIYVREWEERMNKRRLEWKNSIDEMLTQHRAEMVQVQSRILHQQQNLTSHLLGIISQWTTGHPTGLADHTGSGSHYFSNMMQNLQHVNGIVHGDTRVEVDNQGDQFIVDG